MSSTSLVDRLDRMSVHEALDKPVLLFVDFRPLDCLFIEPLNDLKFSICLLPLLNKEGLFLFSLS